MSIWETVQTALTGLGLPLAANTMILSTGEEYPDQYILYQLISNPPEHHADDAEKLRSYLMQVSVFSRDGLATIPTQVETAMLAAGFTRVAGRELPYNQQTRHYGHAADFNLLSED